MPALAVLTAAASAQPPALRVERLGVEEGLSQSTAIALLQDRHGFVWIGTDDGLNRWDGRAARVFRPVPGDTTALSHPSVAALAEGPGGTLWVGTYGGGLCRMDAAGPADPAPRFRCLRHEPRDPASLPEDRVLALLPLGDDLWIGTFEGGLARLDLRTNRLTRYPVHPHGVLHSQVRALAAARGGAVWVGTPAGVQRLDPATGRFTTYALGGEAAHGTVYAVLEDARGGVWVATGTGGLLRLDPRTREVRRFRHDPADPLSLPDDDVQALAFEDGRLWVGTQGGLARLADEAGGRFVRYAADPGDARSLPSDRVRALLLTRGGALWTGTWNAGAARRAPVRFPLFAADPSGTHPLRPHADDLRAFAEAADGALWFGTVAGGLGRMDARTGRFSSFRHRPGDARSLPDDHVRTLFVDRRGTLWVGTNGRGLARFDGDGRFTRVWAEDTGVKGIYEDAAGRLWLGTFGAGVVVLDPATGRVVRALRAGDGSGLPSDDVYALTPGRDSTLWVGSWGGGVAHLDLRTRRVRRAWRHDRADPRSLPDDNVTWVTEARDGTVWAATFGGGLARLDGAGWRAVTTADGLPNNTLYGVVEDAAGWLWLPSNGGLAAYDPRTGRVAAFTVRDGLQSNEFNGSAFLRLRDGRIAAGGIGGFNVFDPAAVLGARARPPRVALASAEVGGRAVAVGRGALRVGDRAGVAFALAAPDAPRPDAVRVRYRLDGLDEAWTEAADGRAVFTRLPAGRYTLRAQAADEGGAWGPALAVPVRVGAPFWRTPAFLVAALLAAVAAGAWGARRGPALLARLLDRLPRRRVVSHYRLDERAGAGGAGEVWRATDLTATRTGAPRTVAVKLLHPHLVEGDGSGPSSDGAQRLRREADLLAALAHPNVVRVYEGGVWGPTPYLAMEWLDGPTLRRRLREGGPLDPPEAVALFALLADALAAVHARGVLHRDVKSENVLLAARTAGDAPRATDDGALGAARGRLPYRPVLMDFGLARTDALSSITQLGALLGTLGYLAPEQATGTAPPDARADVFSLGVTMYEALTGRLPFRADNEIALLHALFNHTPEAPAALAPAVPPALSALVVRCIERERDARPGSAAEVRDALLALSEG